MFRTSPVVRTWTLAVTLAIAAGLVRLNAQIPGRNVNMVSGTTLPDGDPYLQRQNEPSIAASTRNPLHLLAGANDYRTIDMPGLPDDEETGDAWLGVFKSTDGGQRWKSTLIPGYPQDPNRASSPLRFYQAGADPVVRAGTNGLLYYAGLGFNRGTNGSSAVFVARFVDNNNKENGDPFSYLGTTIVASDPGTRFLDKPWMAVDIPRGYGSCTIPNGARGTTRIAAGPVYVTYTALTGTYPNIRSDIYLQSSGDCGDTWSAPVLLSQKQDQINQGSTIAIDPSTGVVYVAWRRFANPGATDGDDIVVVRSNDFGRKFLPPGVARRFPRGKKAGLLPDWVFEHRRFSVGVTEPVQAFDQSSGNDRFRTNGYPTMTVDGSGRVYVAWTERGYSTFRPSPVDGDAKIVMTTSANGAAWTTPAAATEASVPGHQFMPSLTFAGGKLLLLYYDLRDDITQSFAPYADETSAILAAHRRRTMDVRASLALGGAVPSFAASVKISSYALGTARGSRGLDQLQFNPPNLPMFKAGTTPFHGDYIDITPAPAFVPNGKGGWQYNTRAGSTLPVFHAAWTDNRDVRAPRDGNWAHYTPPRSAFNPGATCDPDFVASRNQNIYTSRITGGLIVGAPANSKPLGTTFQRAFVVFAQNTTKVVKTFRMTIVSQPAGGNASFDQFTSPTAPLTTIDVTTAPLSSSTRTVYATSTNPSATIQVDVQEVTGIAGTIVPDGLQATAYLNPDITNPDILNPDILNPDILNPDILNAEVHNPDITNPDITNPDILNPDILNPDILNPDILNPDILNPDITNPDITNTVVMNPDITNPDITNPDILNPDILNPDILNPDILNPDILNGAMSDVTWTMQNNGNTTTAYNVNLFLSQQSVSGLKYQLILHKVYTTPNAVGCDLKAVRNRVLVANIPNPQFTTAANPAFIDQNDPSLANPTLWLSPGEVGFITLRVVNPVKTGTTVLVNGVPVDSAIAQAVANVVTPVVIPQPVGTPDVAGGDRQPPISTPTNSTILFVQQPTSVNVGQAMSPAVSVQVRDSVGAIVGNVQVALALGSNPGGAALSGTVNAVTDPAGIAAFAGLSLDKLGTGYTFVASVAAPGFAPATSAPFDVNGIVVQVPATAGGTENVKFAGGPARTGGTVPVNTGIFVAAGQSITVSATGVITNGGVPLSPDGSGVPADQSFLSNATAQLLVARFGPGSEWQALGSGPTVLTAPSSGFLELAVNDSFYGDNTGAWTATIVPPMANAAWIVTNTNTSGPGSLAAAVAAASSGTGPQGITFNIPGTGPFVIKAPSLVLTNPTYIDGSTQPGYAGTPLIVLDGATPGAAWNGIDVQAADSTVRALAIGNYAGRQGISVAANNAHVYGSFIGTDATGTTNLPNDTGVAVSAGSGAAIGGPLPSQQNVISGNASNGIWIAAGTAHTVAGNRIGVDAPGSKKVPNGVGVLVDSGANTIGGSGSYDANLISGNGVGILFRNASNGTTVRGNLIGTDASATFALGNGEGISSYYGPTGQVITGNRIAGNTTGITLQAGTSATTVSGNTIGLAGVGNTGTGIDIHSTDATSASSGAIVTANTISDNGGAGVAVSGNAPNNTIRLNTILANGGGGITLQGGGNSGQPAPVLSTAYTSPASTVVTYSVPGGAAPYTVDFYAAPGCGQAQASVGSATVVDNAAATFTTTSLAAETTITATATDLNGNTSMFGCVTVSNPPPPQPVYLGPFGGTGGTATPTYTCASGTWATGFRVANGPGLQYALTSVQMLCSDGSALTKIGGGTTPDTDVACNSGDTMIGVAGSTGLAFGGTNPVVTAVGARCAPAGGGSVYQTATLPGGGVTFSADCPAGQAVLAIDGRQGAAVDAIRLTCGAP